MQRAALAGIALSLVALAGCASGNSTPATTSAPGPAAPASTAQASATSTAPKTSAATATDPNGTWKQTNSNSQDSWQEAVVKDGVIEVFWVSNNGDTRSLFWSGTADTPKKAEPFTWTSQGDVEKMKSSLLASQDSTKDFTIQNGELSWKASMMGTTMTIRASKQK